MGFSVQITAAATGPDPNNLGYTWSVSSSDAGVIGVLGQTQDEAAGPTDTVPFLCTAPGTATITVTIDDGPVADGGVCPSNLTTTSTTVTCDAVPANQVAAAWVEIGSGNATIARAVTAAASCPTIAVNGVSQSMNLRSAAGTVPLRTTASTPALSKPSVFPVQTCEMTLPAGTTSAVVGGKTLPLPKASPQTIVVIGDTGCRMKSSGAQWQACSDPTQWPFQRMANLAASLHPDVVLHVGDYHYRENECPPSLAGCAGSPWGYGWDVWEADLFQPGASLLAAAPWIMVRGNHEQCTRGGQGWYRFLDTKAYNTSNNCDNPANDTQASYSDPYSVALGATSQVIVFDSSNVGSSALSPSNSVFTTYQTELQEAANLATNPNIFNIWTNHHPLLGFTPATGTPPTGGNPALLSVMAATYPGTYYPPNINLALHGHTHLFETIDFASTSLPATIVTGTGGDALDVTLPNPFDLTLQPAAGATVANIADAANFGFLFMQYQPASSTWLITAYRVDGTVRDTCTANLNGQISCTSWGYLN